MRLHLTIQRHGLPVTRILWTTSSPSILGQNAAGTRPTASASAIASTRAPNATYGNGAYTIAQLLEDVNEVVPLETQGHATGEGDDEYGGQWGLEDYVVEVGGFECLHFMEVEGLLREGDEVVIRALQTSDLRARRISGRHQISVDGRHLIDGVPFGRPYLKRSFSSRPAIKIPPRKRRRITLSGWSAGADPEEDDVEWAFPEDGHAGKELTLFHNEVESDQGTVIRHPPDEVDDVQGSDSDADASDFEDEDLTEELQALREDLEADETPDVHRTRDEGTRGASGRVSRLKIRTPERAKPSESPVARSSSSVSHRHSERIITESPKTSKNVRFQKESEEEVSSASESEESEIEDESNSEVESSDEVHTSSSSVVSDSSDEESTSESEEESTSESEEESSESEDEDEEVEKPEAAAKAQAKMNPPGKGSEKTRKSNRRNKLRRKLSKLKELGILPPKADFAALRAYEANSSGGPLTEVKDVTEGRPQTKEQLEFEARRQKLLRDLRSGGVDIDGYSEKENVPPAQYQGLEPAVQTVEKEVPTPEVSAVDITAEVASEPVKRRALDVASSKRLLFGSLGLRTPKSKEDEEATRKKLAAKTKPFVSLRESANEAGQEAVSDGEENWQEKLVVKATECVFDDIELTAPPFPFEQRWDAEAHEIIGQRKGWGKRKGRRKRQKAAEAEAEAQAEDYDYGPNSYWNGENGDVSLNYDDEQSYLQDDPETYYAVEDQPMQDVNGDPEVVLEQSSDDLPPLPADVTSVADLVEGEVKHGTIIAFKQLDMSKATNWQPQVSAYRVAEVDRVLENGTINVRLAKRDRERREEDVDLDEDGSRAYSGFEMPGFEDEMTEDDGVRELSFGELIEPKLLRAGAAGEGDARGASVEDAVPDENRTISDGGPAAPVEASVVAVSSQTRNEISQLIQDAGFRSKIDSDLLAPEVGLASDELLKSVEHDPDETQDEQASASSFIQSPTFAGFPSSPPSVRSVDDGNSPGGSHQSTPSPTARRGKDEKPDGRGSPSPGTKSPSPRSDGSTPGYPSLPALSDRARRQTDEEQHETPDDANDHSSDDPPPPGSSHGLLSDPLPSDMPQSQIVESQQTHSRASSTVPNPFYEEDRAYEERGSEPQEESQVSHVPETQETQEMQSDPLDFDLPPFEVLMSSTAPPPTTTPFQSPPPRRRTALSSPRQLTPSPGPIAEPPSGPELLLVERAGPSRASEIVDLTVSSPPGSAGDGSDEDFARARGLPRGPGWVQKNVPATGRRT